MVKARSWLALVVISFGTLAATVSCGSDEVTGGAGGGLITGGSGGSNAGSAGKGGVVGRGGTTSGGTTSTSGSLLGAPCVADQDCDGLKCLTPDDASLPTTGGPSNGLCTMVCKSGTECDAVSPGAGCLNFGDAAYCMEGCTQGEPADLTTKCHGRPDEACEAFPSGSVMCRPTCRADAECATGQFCNRLTGLCSKTKQTGDAPGTPCDPMAATNSCLGICLITSDAAVTPQTGVCAQLCPLGVPCMYNGMQPGGLCAGAISTGAGTLDLGFCESGCGCTSDCSIPGDVCQAWTAADAMLKAAIGSAGICFGNATGSVELTCGGEGGAGGVGNTPGGDTAGAPAN